jgi:hypothetical protein
MTAADALKVARTAGIELHLDGDDLVLEASAPPPAEILDLLLRHKPAIVLLLQPGRDGWSTEDWQGFFAERARLAELNAGLLRPMAEANAFTCCIVKWLNRNFARTQPGRCAACGGEDRCHEPIVPFGIESTGHVWLHPRCWRGWHARRQAEAVAFLKAMGIASPPEFSDDFGKNGGT